MESYEEIATVAADDVDIRVVADEIQYVVVLEWVDGDVTVHGPYDVQEAAVAAAHDLFKQHQQVCLARHRRLTAALWTEGAAKAHLAAALRVPED